MNTVDIYFDDLTEEAQQRVMEAMGIEDYSEGNFELGPFFILEFEPEDT
jgi:hypothetical protein